MSKYLSHRPFLVIDLYHRPARGVRTERRGWGDLPGTWHTDENPYVVARVSDKHLRTATVIIDLTTRTLVKNRFADSPAEEVVNHFLGKYAKQCSEAVAIHQFRQAHAAPAPASAVA